MILTGEVSAIRLNEIEANPEGTDSGNEWVELYSQDSVNLEGYFLENGDGGIYNLSGSFSGYFVVDFPGQWLDNTDETVYLKLNGEIIDTAGSFRDNKINKTYSLCDGTWSFISETKNEENSCSGSNPTQSSTPQQNNQNNEEEEEIVEDNKDQTVNENVPLTNTVIETKQEPNKKIILSNIEDSDSNGVEVTRTYKTRIGVIYFFIGLCVLLVVLIAFKKL